MTVRLSEDPLSGFGVDLNGGTIDICLQNILASRVLVVVVDRRYGSILGPTMGEYANLSATHAEVAFARKNDKKILYFIRDAAQADAGRISHDAKSSATWLDKDQASDVSKFIRYLNEGSPWIHTFRTSVDLKPMVLKRVTEILPEYSIWRALLPDHILRISFTLIGGAVNAGRGTVIGVFRNIGPGPAFNIEHGVQSGTSQCMGGLAQGESIVEHKGSEFTYHFTGEAPGAVYCSYENRFRDKYRVEYPLEPQNRRLVAQGREKFLIWSTAEKWVEVSGL
jgi:hypothetical protein